MHVKLGIVISLGAGLIASYEKEKAPHGICGSDPKACTPSSSVSDRVKVGSESQGS